MTEELVKPNWDNAYRKVALRGLLWTSPLWAGIFLNTACIASKEFDDFLGAWHAAYSLVPFSVIFGASLCLFAGWAFSKRNLGVADALKRGMSSALMVAFAYLMFAFFSFFFAADEKGPAWGGAFGLIGAGASLVAAAMGAVARLFWNLVSGLFARKPETPPETKE